MGRFFVVVGSAAAALGAGAPQALAVPSHDFGTYYGGGADEYASDVDFNASGLADVVGGTESFPGIATPGSHRDTPVGSQEGFISQWRPDGTLSWATYYGGNGFDQFWALVHNDDEDIFAVGETTSPDGTNWVATLGADQTALQGARDAMLVRFTSTGGRTWGTFLGGNNEDWGYGICIGPTGNLFIVGMTTSTTGLDDTMVHDHSLNNLVSDGFVAKVSSTGTVQWATYIGGSDGRTEARDCEVDASDNVYVVGYTEASTGDVGIPSLVSADATYGGSGDAFIVKFNTSGVRQWGRYYGGTGPDWAEAIDINDEGDLLVAGWTESATDIANIVDTTISGRDAFVAKFLPSTGARRWARYWGADSQEEFDDIEVVGSTLHLSGWTGSSSGIATVDAFQPTFGGGLGTTDAVFVIMNDSASVTYATYIGGDHGENGMGVAAEVGNAAVSGYTRGSLSGVATPGAHDTSWNGGTLINPFDAMVQWIGSL
ncbi:SBBP repeat-containing protein [Nannocystis punicea]|uniref:SBBP repeat-containing protein n=1 Tax=Nannocystis punicea TaxID=2995304 RepID=A0ABY7HC84_9BACT|nr:SBBP repeat-containing protein [Nannocystis poenicansa]WAS96700.1 SBBP repeat-containing protein [Nannocystis poenicansa]